MKTINPEQIEVEIFLMETEEAKGIEAAELDEMWSFVGKKANQRHLPEDKHEIGKKKTQRIEQKHIRLRTRVKRLQRKTICFSRD